MLSHILSLLFDTDKFQYRLFHKFGLTTTMVSLICNISFLKVRDIGSAWSITIVLKVQRVRCRFVDQQPWHHVQTSQISTTRPEITTTGANYFRGCDTMSGVHHNTIIGGLHQAQARLSCAQSKSVWKNRNLTTVTAQNILTRRTTRSRRKTCIPTEWLKDLPHKRSIHRIRLR